MGRYAEFLSEKELTRAPRVSKYKIFNDERAPKEEESVSTDSGVYSKAKDWLSSKLSPKKETAYNDNNEPLEDETKSIDSLADLAPAQRYGEIKQDTIPDESATSYLLRQLKGSFARQAAEGEPLKEIRRPEIYGRRSEKQKEAEQISLAKDIYGANQRSKFTEEHPIMSKVLGAVGKTPEAAATLAPVIAAGAAAPVIMAVQGAKSGLENTPDTEVGPNVLNKIIGAAAGAGEATAGAKLLGLGTKGKGFVKPFLGTEAAGTALSMVGKKPSLENLAESAAENVLPAALFAKVHQKATERIQATPAKEFNEKTKGPEVNAKETPYVVETSKHKIIEPVKTVDEAAAVVDKIKPAKKRLTKQTAQIINDPNLKPEQVEMKTDPDHDGEPLTLKIKPRGDKFQVVDETTKKPTAIVTNTPQEAVAEASTLPEFEAKKIGSSLLKKGQENATIQGKIKGNNQPEYKAVDEGRISTEAGSSNLNVKGGEVPQEKGALSKGSQLKLYSGLPIDELYKAALTHKINKADLFPSEELDLSKPAMRKNAKGELIPITAGKVTAPEALFKNIDKWKDVKISTGAKLFKDLDRQLESVSGKDYPVLRKYLIDNRENADLNFTREVAQYKDELKNHIGKKLGIKINSKESAAVQRFGEKRQSLESLKKQFPDKWENIVEAEKWFSNNYNKILEEVNQVLKAHNRKPIEKRKDYFTHFNDIWNTWKDMFQDKGAASPAMIGVSDFTQPNAPFNPYSLKRKGSKFKDDAVAGFEKYIVPTLRQKHFTPEISRLRAFTKALREKTLETKNLNNFIESLTWQGNVLAGKTNPIDRLVQSFLVGRKGMKLIDFASRQLGKNQIIGNLSSAVMQTASIPPTLARTGPVNFLKGMLATISHVAKKQSLSKVSPMLERRYTDLGSIKSNILQKAEKGAAIPFKVIEQFTTTSSWFANYYHAKSEGLTEKEAKKYADHWTRRQVAGRSIGEKPIAFESKVGNLGMMFQLEVNNLVQQYVHDYKPKNLGNVKTMALIIVYSALFNNIFESLTGRRPLPDPIKTAIDTYNSDNLKEAGGRIAGEILSNVAGGQTVAGFMPEQTRRKYMGRTEVGMYGGTPLGSAIQRGFKKPSTFITSFVTPFGGSQASKTYRGLKAIEESPKELTTAEKAKAVLFGPMSLSSQNTKAIELAKDYLSKRPEFESTNPEKTDLRRKGWKLLKRTGKLPEDVIEARKGGKLSRSDIKYITKTAKLKDIQRVVKPLSLEESLKVYYKANDEERKSLRRMISRKLKSFARQHSIEDREEIKQSKEYKFFKGK